MENKIIVIVDSDLEDLIPGFLMNRENDLVKLKESLSANDFETIRIIGHSMKGFGSGYGFDFISEVGFELEKSAKQKQVEEIETHIKSIEDYLQTIEIRYE
ncbi:hypothetical protein [Bacillus sp. FJAT-45350]|uniref:hypothetical protein n=1 Tax=Bacillus sp. FJAT-45350 TaxID=2011014 RepID=UPI001C53F3A7|nr:hypothetical protein [Bacillus sp. FJAT-45350]